MKKLILLVLLFAISAFAGLANHQNLFAEDLVYVPPVTLYQEPQSDTTYKVVKIDGKLFITREYQKVDTLKIEVK